MAIAGPPEFITGCLMSGAGDAPMIASSGEFTASAIAFEVAIDRLVSQLAYLLTNWQCVASTAMSQSLIQFIVWMRLLQAQLMLAATRTGAQAAAFAEAYATMAQMPEIVENRVTTQVLYATNFLGMNTIPIGVREGQYTEMWIRDIAVQTAYLAQTVANTTFEPFVPPQPITGMVAFPSVIEQAINSALSAGDRLLLASYKVQGMLSVLKSQMGMAVGTAELGGRLAESGGEQAEAQAALGRNREDQLQNQAQNKMGEQLGQQLIQQAVQQAGTVGQQLIQLPQQLFQQVQQGAQQLTQQFGSQLGQLMSKVAEDHRLDNPGFFDTKPTSPTLDRLAGSTGVPGLTAALRVPTLGGLSGVSTGFRFPSGWEGTTPASPSSPSTAAARPLGGSLPLHTRARDDEENRTITRDQTELSPIWGDDDEAPETVSAGSFVVEQQGAGR
ncbi:MAG: PPE family protein [Gordonia amarae]